MNQVSLALCARVIVRVIVGVIVRVIVGVIVRVMVCACIFCVSVAGTCVGP